MNEQEVRAILAAAMAYDNRRPGEANIAAWAEAAARGRWTFESALEAVHSHYATSTEFLMPGHITAAVRARMRIPAPASEAVAAIVAAAPAEEAVRRRWTAIIRDRFAMPPRLRDEPGRPRERRPQRRSVDDAAARERARRELDAIRDQEPPDDLVG